MPRSVQNPEYHVDTFLDMELGLQNYLNEAFDNTEGTWTRSQKQRFLNLGCINVAAKVLQPKRTFKGSVEATPEDITDTFVVPGGVLKPHRLWIDDNSYHEVNEEDWFRNLVALDRAASFHGRRIFWYDMDEMVVNFAPAVHKRSDVVFRYVKMPRKLVKDGDVPDLHTLLWHVPPMWAAWRMTYRDEEHGDRGRSARADYKDAIREFQEFKFKESGNKQAKITLDPLMFPDKRNLTAGIDLGDTFDILD